MKMGKAAELAFLKVSYSFRDILILDARLFTLGRVSRAKIKNLKRTALT